MHRHELASKSFRGGEPLLPEDLGQLTRVRPKGDLSALPLLDQGEAAHVGTDADAHALSRLIRLGRGLREIGPSQELRRRGQGVGVIEEFKEHLPGAVPPPVVGQGLRVVLEGPFGPEKGVQFSGLLSKALLQPVFVALPARHPEEVVELVYILAHLRFETREIVHGLTRVSRRPLRK